VAAAIAEQGFRLLSEAMRAATAAHGEDPVTALRLAGVAYVEFGVHYPDHLQVMFGDLIARAEDYPTLVAASKDTYELLAAIVREGMRVGRLRGPDERTVALAAWSLVHGLAVLVAGGQIRVERKQAPALRELAMVVTGLLHQGITIAAVPAKASGRKPRSEKGKVAR